PSGTLGYLFGELGRGRRFSQALRGAIAKGYPEPDPREDLSGMDVARKALILGRLLGFPGELKDIAVESLVPPGAERLTPEEFLARLEEYDAPWTRRLAQARRRGGALRYRAIVTRRRIRVGLVVVDASSPMASLNGTDNQFIFTTTRYRKNPLVITGPGAGPAVTAGGILNDVLKHEGLNPTGSFKDRGMTVAVTQARRVGATALACASTGNTGASLAAYAGLAGLPALVMVPQGQVALGKLTQTIAYGARTLLVRGNFDACLDLAEQARERLGLYLVNSINPFRIEGQKTIVLELLQQLDWTAPDWIVLPAGNLGNTAAFGKALAEAREWGLISDTPRLAAVQAGGAAPFAASFREGVARRHRVEPHTVASASDSGNPASYDRAVRAIRETHGVVTAVTD